MNTYTHYAPWDETEDTDRARCGHRMEDTDVHSLTPTCPICAASVAGDDAVHAANQRLATARMSPFGAHLFLLASLLNSITYGGGR